ncbi:hypothetical protein ESCO_005654 [Escovopsis weberi]|uniref:Ubiquitin 3 binding protein But2 C-terminal domain-containing protein n=1 Tax=Escovopsis weberi TaxID=150374 RepID=A0A0M9VUG9_ESCWE|nr:hypothetical protein ESCO_005654 [Escovopsis weberi]
MRPLAFCLALLPLTHALTIHFPRTLNSPAVKDATILRWSSAPCPSCPSSSCAKCTLGLNNTFLASSSSSSSSSSDSDSVPSASPAYAPAPAPAPAPHAVSLIGFQLTLPASAVHSCTVQFPAFTRLPRSNLTVLFEQVPAAGAGWDEASVDALSAPAHGPLIASVPVPALSNMPAVDLTSACRAAGPDGQFSVYVSAEEGRFEIWSKDSGNPAILHVQPLVE